MAYRPPVAVFDACVLYPFHLRNLLIQCAFDGLVEARWTDDIHAEWMRNLAANSPNIPIARLEITRDKMKAVLPDADVVTHKALISSLSLPDPDDRHVLAAAIAGGAGMIVTWNLKDFPASHIAAHGTQAVAPDAFLSGLHKTQPEALIDSVGRARQNLRRTAPSVEEFISTIEAQGLVDFASILRRQKIRLSGKPISRP